MLIHVTQAHIDSGSQSDCDLCPIALALMDALPGSKPLVYFASFVVGVGEYALPRFAQGFILDFDVHGSSAVRPFSFEFDDSLPVN